MAGAAAALGGGSLRVGGPRRIDVRLVASACACSAALLLGAALVEALVVPDLLPPLA